MIWVVAHWRAAVMGHLYRVALVLLLATAVTFGDDQAERDGAPVPVSEQMLASLRADAARIARRARQPQEISKAFRELKRVPHDPTRLVEYIRMHPDYTSYVMLMALRETSPEAYASLSQKTRAAVILDLAKWSPGHLGFARFKHAADGPEKATMTYSVAGKALLALDPNAVLPLMRDALRIIEPLDLPAAGTKLRTCNYFHWFAAALLGEKPWLGRWKDCAAMHDRITQMRADDRGEALPQARIEALLRDAGAGKPFAESTVLWHLYDGHYDLSALGEAVTKHPDLRSLHALLALRRLSPGDYMDIDPAVRAKVLVSALRDGRFAADFGAVYLSGEVQLGDLWHPPTTVLGVDGIREAGLALLEAGPAAIPGLASLRATEGVDDHIAGQARSFQDVLDVLDKTGLQWTLWPLPGSAYRHLRREQ